MLGCSELPEGARLGAPGAGGCNGVMEPILFTADELRLVADEQFFRDKARIMKKVRGTLDALYTGLKEELHGIGLLAPPGFNREEHQIVNRYETLADKQISLCLGGTPWEWKRGEGYTMELTWDRKVDLVALLSHRSFLKL